MALPYNTDHSQPTVSPDLTPPYLPRWVGADSLVHRYVGTKLSLRGDKHQTSDDAASKLSWLAGPGNGVPFSLHFWLVRGWLVVEKQSCPQTMRGLALGVCCGHTCTVTRLSFSPVGAPSSVVLAGYLHSSFAPAGVTSQTDNFGCSPNKDRGRKKPWSLADREARIRVVESLRLAVYSQHGIRPLLIADANIPADTEACILPGQPLAAPWMHVYAKCRRGYSRRRQLI
ncbi:hypothetical protein F4808DRAFT_311091 [Astrocystis sublimbata]|nr:hypothetical protein F4808DRAFT_311091 [Astrocystis sublimbata]